MSVDSWSPVGRPPGSGMARTPSLRAGGPGRAALPLQFMSHRRALRRGSASVLTSKRAVRARPLKRGLEVALLKREALFTLP
jgi:hypothetical protein